MTRDDYIAWVLIGLVFCFFIGFVFGTWEERSRAPTVIHITEHQRRVLCMREQSAVVSTWRRWTEKAAAAGECRAYVLRGDEP